MLEDQAIQEIANFLREGNPVIVYDKKEREDECDIFFLADKITPENIREMRKKGGGLICVSILPKIANILGLPYLRELLAKKANGPIRHLVRKNLPYGAHSTFSLTVNHIETFTGITDKDRALTISKLGKLCSDLWKGRLTEKKGREKFLENFRAPGHVFLLRGVNGLLFQRSGHTELSLAIARLGKLTPCIALVEMLGNDGEARSISSAKKFANKNGYPFLRGKEIIESFKSRFSGN